MSISEDMPSSAEELQHFRPSFLHHFNRKDVGGDIPSVIHIDHSYAKPWTASAELQTYARPAFMLFASKATRTSDRLPLSSNGCFVDVESVDEPEVLPYDQEKARSLMTECERNANFARSLVIPDDTWETSLNRDNWTPAQSRLFNRVTKLLQSDRLSRLAHEGHPNEPILRRLSIDRTAKRIRHVLAAIEWDMSLTTWLHSTLVAVLGQSMLTAYLNVLQVIRSKAPSQVEIMMGVDEGEATDETTLEALQLLLKRPWDPLSSFISQHRLTKLPGGASLVIVPDIPSEQADSHWVPAAVRRAKFWNAQLSGLGKIVHVGVGPANTTTQFAAAVETAVRTRCSELQERHPSRSIILIGWHVGALIACRLSLLESVTAVVALGFPTQFVNGTCGDADDPLVDMHTPTLFVVGQNAPSCCLDDLEDLRERMQVDTSLVIVGGSNDHLEMSQSQRMAHGLTQNVIDRCIIEKISDFLHDVTSHSAEGASCSDIPEEQTQLGKPPSQKKHKVKVVTSRTYSSSEHMGGGDAETLTNQTSSSRMLTVSVAPDQQEYSPVKRRKKSIGHHSTAVRHRQVAPMRLSSSMPATGFQVRNGVPSVRRQHIQLSASSDAGCIGVMRMTSNSVNGSDNSSVMPTVRFQHFVGGLSSIMKSSSTTTPMTYNLVQVSNVSQSSEHGHFTFIPSTVSIHNPTFLSQCASGATAGSASSASSNYANARPWDSTSNHADMMPTSPGSTSQMHVNLTSTRTRVIKVPKQYDV